MRFAKGEGLARSLLAPLIDRAGISIDGPERWDIQVHDRRFFRRVLLGGSLAFGESYVDGWWDCPHLDELVHRSSAPTTTTESPTGSTSCSVRAGASRTCSRCCARPRWRRRTTTSATSSSRRCSAPRCAIRAATGATPTTSTTRSARRWSSSAASSTCGAVTGCSILGAASARSCATRPSTTAARAWASPFRLRSASGRPRPMPGCRFASSSPTTVRKRSRALARSTGWSRWGCSSTWGRRNYDAFFRAARRLLRDDGLMLLHTIGTNHDATDPWMNRYIFPNGELPSSVDLARAVRGRFVVEDWHNFRADYDRTILAWHDNFQRHAASPAYRQDERFRRMWSYYLLAFAGVSARACAASCGRSCSRPAAYPAATARCDSPLEPCAFGATTRTNLYATQAGGGSAARLAAATTIPIQDVLALPEQDARLLLHVGVDGLEVLDPMRHPADVRVHGNGHDPGRLLSLLVEPVELIARAIEQLSAPRDAGSASSGYR